MTPAPSGTTRYRPSERYVPVTRSIDKFPFAESNALIHTGYRGQPDINTYRLQGNMVMGLCSGGSASGGFTDHPILLPPTSVAIAAYLPMFELVFSPLGFERWFCLMELCTLRFLMTLSKLHNNPLTSLPETVFRGLELLHDM